MNSSLTLNELLNESFAVSRTCHKVRGCSRSISSQFLQRRKKKQTNKQTKLHGLKSLGTTLKTRALIPIWSALFCKHKVSEEIKFR